MGAMRNGWGCATLPFCCIFLLGMGGTMAKSHDDYRAKLHHIDRTDGISKEEAIIIAQNHLIEGGTDKEVALSKPSVEDSRFTVDGAGHPLAPCWEVRFNATWKVRLESGLKWVRVLVDKKTGQIKSSVWGPS